MIARDDQPSRLSLTEDETDDILYAVRTNDKEELDNALAQLRQKYAVESTSLSVREILEAAIAEDSGNSALHYAAANGLTTLLTHLFTLSSPSISAEEHATSSSSSSPPALINARNEAGSTPLHWAALNGHLEAVKVLIAAKADMWARNEAGNLAVFEAERAGHDAVVAELLKAGGGSTEGGEGKAAGEEMDVAEGEAEGEDVVMTMKAGDVEGGEALEEDMANARIQE